MIRAQDRSRIIVDGLFARMIERLGISLGEYLSAIADIAGSIIRHEPSQMHPDRPIGMSNVTLPSELPPHIGQIGGRRMRLKSLHIATRALYSSPWPDAEGERGGCATIIFDGHLPSTVINGARGQALG